MSNFQSKYVALYKVSPPCQPARLTCVGYSLPAHIVELFDFAGRQFSIVDTDIIFQETKPRPQLTDLCL